MEGARWNNEDYYVDESYPKVLYDDFPPVSEIPRVNIRILMRFTYLL